MGLYKAISMGVDVPDLLITATEVIPHISVKDPKWEDKVRALYESQASEIFQALIASLPGGTIEALLCRLLDQSRTLLRVTFTNTKES